ncbi:MAG: hypothetical protein J5548_10685 [Prevotella sp.]|nr:hypothetical protein [Prevotella sp.]
MNTEDLLELANEVGADNAMSVKDLLGLQFEIPDLIFQINVGKYRLAITYGKGENGVIKKYKGNIFTLNIRDKEPHASFDLKSEWVKHLINKQLSIFMPIIQKFMVDALTDNLSIMEDNKLK